jgi:hypothetical protein
MSGVNLLPTGLNSGRGKTNHPQSTDSSANSSPSQSTNTNNNKKPKTGDPQNNEIKNPEKKHAIDLVKALSTEELLDLNRYLTEKKKAGLSESQMSFFYDDNAEKEDNEEFNLASQSNKEKESVEVIALKQRYNQLEMEMDRINEQLINHGVSEDFFDKDMGFIGSSQTSQSVYQEKRSNYEAKSKPTSKAQYEFIVKLKLNDRHFTDPIRVTRQIKDHKGNVNIEKAFFNRYNNLLYLCTNDEGAFKTLSLPWPPTAFNKGAEVFVETPRVPKYFIAINGIAKSIDLENDQEFVKICQINGISNLQRMFRREKGEALSTIKAQVIDKDTFEKLIKFGLKYDYFSYKISPWKFNQFQPIQCFICQKYGHYQQFCTSNIQRCLRCSGEHKHKECNPTNPIKCSNCNGPHPACSQKCPVNIKETLKKKEKLIGRATSNIDPSRPFNKMFDNNDKLPNNSKSTQRNFNSNNNTIITQFMQLLSQFLNQTMNQTDNLSHTNDNRSISRRNE